MEENVQNENNTSHNIIPEVGIFILLKYETELEIVASDISFNSVRPLHTSKFVLKSIWLATISNLFLD